MFECFIFVSNNNLNWFLVLDLFKNQIISLDISMNKFLKIQSLISI